MRMRFWAMLLAGALGAAGCGSGDPEIITNPSQLKPETPEQAKAIKAEDEKIREEEGGSYDAKARPGFAGRAGR